MGLFELRKPKWHHKNPAVRLEAISSIDPQEIELLSELAREDQDREVRHAAIRRLMDVPALDQLEDGADPEDLHVIIDRKENLLYDQVVACREGEEWYENLDQITSPELLAKIAVNGSQPAVRLDAVNRIEDQRLLAEIVQQNCGKKPAMAAMEKITDEHLLAELVKSAASKTSRRLATEKLAEIEYQKNQLSDREVVARKLHTLADEAARLHNTPDIDAAALRLAAIKKEWRQYLDSATDHPAHNDFRETCDDFEEKYQEILYRRKIGQEKTIRLEQFQDQLDEICSTIERLSCSTAPDAQAAKEKAVADWAALVNDPNSGMEPNELLSKRFTHCCQVFDTNREQIDFERECIKDIGTKCSDAQKLIASHDLKKAAARLLETRKAFDSIEFKYFNKSLIEKLLSEVSADLDHAEQEIRSQNLASGQGICTKLEKLTKSEKPSHLERHLQSLQEEWQQLVKVKGPEGEELDKRYQTIVADLNERLKTLQHQQDWQLWANLSLKEKLVERVVALDQEENLETVVTVVKESQVEWKKIGHVPQNKSQELWDTFQSACNRNFERAKPYHEELQTKRAAAMDRRRDICTQAAELAESNDWRKSTQAIKELQEEWKTLLRGSRREEQKLYQQFRKSCNRFFERRKEHYQLRDEERHQNLLNKEKLCEQAELLAAESQIDYPKKFRTLQDNWKKIGPVPRNKEDAVWKRFRAACDKYFDWLEEQQKNNLKLKEELCEQIEKLAAEAITGEIQQEFATKVKELQQQWKDIGPVARDQSDAVWQRFRKSCDEFFTANRQQQEKKEEQQRLNQNQKEELLARAEELASEDTDKETASRLKQLQKEWFELGTAPREIDSELNDRFKTVCDAFFEGRRQFFIDLKQEQLDNLKKKESLCLRLENILGLTGESGTGGENKALSLAEELKQAMEDNFMLAGRRNERKGISEEVNRIQKDWKQVGPVPFKQTRSLTARYNKALGSYFEKKCSKKK